MVYLKTRKEVTTKEGKSATLFPPQIYPNDFTNTWKYRSAEQRREDGKKQQGYSRRRVLELLGANCKKCGNKDVDVLEIHHRNFDGKFDRRVSSVYSRLYKVYKTNPAKFFLKYELLCANCHRKAHRKEDAGGK